jgi:hypothetical protein
MQFLLGADDEVAVRQYRRQMRGHGIGADVAGFARVVPGQAPEIRAVIDIEDDAPAVRAGETNGLVLRRRRAGLGEMRACHDDGSGRGDEILPHVVFAQRHVGAVVAVEDERKGMAVAHAQYHQGGQPLLVRHDARGFHALARQLFQDEAADLLIPHPRQKRGFQPQPRGAHGDIGGAAADGLAEGPHILKSAADLLTIEIKRTAADRDEVERGNGHGNLLCLAGAPIRQSGRSQPAGRFLKAASSRLCL